MAVIGDAEVPGILRIDFAKPTEGLKDIGREVFFEQLETIRLAFHPWEETRDGGQSWCNELADS